MNAPLFKGVITALITPFRDGRIDEDAFARLIERQIAAGVHGLVPMGTTGESATVSVEEHQRAVEMCVSVASGRVRVIAGAGATATDKSIALATHAKRVGADGVLVVTPYYNRPSQAGMAAHFTAIADQVQVPILLYNVPSRTGVDLSNDTLATLSAHPNIVGIKDATGDLGRLSAMRNMVPEGFALISGDDPSYPGYLAQGGHGVISVTSNVAPEAMVHLTRAIWEGDLKTARTTQSRLIRLHRALFLDSSPAPTKYALARLGLCDEGVRLPLLACAEAVRPEVDAAMLEAGLAPDPS